MYDFNDNYNVEEPNASQPAAPLTPTKKGLGLSLSGFIFGILSIIHGCVFLYFQLAFLAERDFVKEQYDHNPMYDVTFDYSLFEKVSTGVRIYIIVIAAFSLLLSVIGIAKAKNTLRRKKSIIFSVLGIVGAVIGIALTVGSVYFGKMIVK